MALYGQYSKFTIENSVIDNFTISYNPLSRILQSDAENITKSPIFLFQSLIKLFKNNFTNSSCLTCLGSIMKIEDSEINIEASIFSNNIA
jgi:hypothetical protein